MTINSKEMFGLSDSHVVSISDGQRLLPIVAEKFIQMQEAARDEGLDLQICSGFRDFDRQLSIWNRKWVGELPILTLEGKQLDITTLTVEQKLHAILLWSALPGASRHHWGTDFDVYDKAAIENIGYELQLIPEEYEGEGPCAKLSRWLATHAASFGFGFPYAEYTGGVAKEPWHLSFMPVSENIIQRFDIKLLRQSLESSSIKGKSTILACLPEIIERYTLNKGTV